MKRGLLVAIALLSVFTTGAMAQISGSAHDFSSQGWSGGEICLPCHTPHSADNSVSAPLWNHELTTATYTLYSSSTLDSTIEQPGTFSRLCLSCHDGTVALDSYGGVTGINFIDAEANMGTDLSNDHPIGVIWPTQHQPGQQQRCDNCHLGGGPKIGENMPLPFFDRKIECATCHDVHNTNGYPKLIRKTLDNSELCLHCHNM